MPDQRPQGGPDPEWQFFDLQDFGGINTLSPRQSIEDNEFSYLENFFPIAKGNLRTLYDKGASVYTAPSGKTIVFFDFYEILGVSYAFVCLSDGTGYQVNTATQAVTAISATTSTFYTGSQLPDCVQWGRQYLQIVNNTAFSAYFIWDGSVLYQGGTLGPVITVTNGGQGYTGNPTFTVYGGSGSGATITGTVTNGSLVSAVFTNPGFGYLATDPPVQVQVKGGGQADKTAIITANISGGAVSGINIVDGGAGYQTAPIVTFVGGGGSGASITLTISGGAVNGSSGLVGGTGYAEAPSVELSAGNNPFAAMVTVSMMPIGVSGTTIENYLSRAWIGNNAVDTFSSPGDPANFNPADGSGTLTSQDGFLKNRFVCFKQSNSYLYTIGDSSINAINNVTSSGSPLITTSNNTNADAQVGTPWRDSVQTYGSTLSAGNSSGIYLIYGGIPQKISEPLNGMFATAALPSTGNGPSSAVGTIFGIKVWMILLTILDPFTNMLTPKLVCFEAERKKWFVASQSVTLTYIATQEVNSVLTAWGTDGNSLFPLLTTPSATLVKKGLTKLWNGESYLWFKQLMRIYCQAADQSSKGASITFIAQTEQGNSVPVVLSGGGNIVFVNNTNGVLRFQNNTPANLNFTTTGNSINMQNSSIFGYLMGLQFTSTSEDFVITAMTMAYKKNRFLQ